MAMIDNFETNKELISQLSQAMSKQDITQISLALSAIWSQYCAGNKVITEDKLVAHNLQFQHNVTKELRSELVTKSEFNAFQTRIQAYLLSIVFLILLTSPQVEKFISLLFKLI